MATRGFAKIELIALTLCSSLLCVTTSAVEPKKGAISPTYRPPRTMDGKPDLQGFWTNSSVTRLERPAAIQKLVLTESEAAAMVQNDALVERVRKDAQSIDPKTGMLDGRDLAAGQGYNAFSTPAKASVVCVASCVHLGSSTPIMGAFPTPPLDANKLPKRKSVHRVSMALK